MLLIMNIISEKTIRDFYLRNANTKDTLCAVILLLRKCKWNKPQDVAETVGPENYDTCENNRVCIDIRGVKVRIILRNNYHSHTSFVRFIGWHKDYDKIDCNTI